MTKWASCSHTGSQVSNTRIKTLLEPYLEICFAVFVFTPFVILLGWNTSIIAGHTKRE